MQERRGFESSKVVEQDGVFGESSCVWEDGVFGGVCESRRTEVLGIMVRVGGQCIRGLGKGGRMVLFRFSEVMK
jgi:hypothetical protein